MKKGGSGDPPFRKTRPEDEPPGLLDIDHWVRTEMIAVSLSDAFESDVTLMIEL